MAYSKFHALALLLSGVTLVTSAAESEVKYDAIEISLGETAYIQLTSSTPTGRPVAAIRVQNPNRDYLVIKVTFEAGESGAKHQLKVRNGYEQLVYFATKCPQLAKSDRPEQLLVGTPPGREAKMEIPTSTTKVSLCDFTLAAVPTR